MDGAKQLALAIGRGQLEGEGGVRSLLDAGVSASETIQLIGTPLMFAAMENHVDIMELLVARGADVDAHITHEGPHPSYPNGWRALFVTIAGEKVEAFRFLLRMGANPNVVHGDHRTTPLMMACEADAGPLILLMVRELLEAGADPTMANANMKTALHIAAYHGHGSDVIHMLTAKAPKTLVNQLDYEGRTALAYAAHYGQEAAVSCLLSVGANDQAMLQRTGKTSLCWAAGAGHEGVVRKMVASKSNFNAVGGRLVLARTICMAAMDDWARILHKLLNAEGEGKRQFWARAKVHYAGGDRGHVSAYDVACIEGIPGLHVAATYGVVRSVRLLLAAGADETALDFAGNCVSEVIGVSM